MTVTADESANYNKKTVNISVKVIAASTVITSLNDISVNYGDGLTDNLIVGTAKNEYGTVVAGQFAFKNQGLKPTVAQSGLYAVVFTPLDGNYEASEANVNVNVKKIDVIVTAYGAGKAVGQSDPSFKYETTGLINGDTLNILLSRAAGEAVGEYEYTLGDSTADNYNLLLSGNEKFHIYGQLVSFNYGDAFKYRLGTVGTVTLDVNLAEGVDVGTLKFVSSTEIGNATVSVTGKTATVSGSGLVKLSAMVDGCYDTVFDQYIFEVVEGGKNVTALAAMSSAGNVILHSDVEVTTSGFSVGEGSSLYGNGYTVNASNINPASNYQSVVTLSGLLKT